MNNSEAKENICNQLTFEEAFSRLDEILEKMNSSSVSLDDSLKLYEEADRLINICGKRLADAERKIESLVKNRSGELVMGNDQKPATQEFTPPNWNK